MRDESGQSLVEALLLGLLFLVPIMWGLTVLSDLHAGALAATAAAREAGMEAARTSDRSSADLVVRAAVTEAFENQGLEAADAEVSWSAPSDMARGGAVEVVVSYPVSVARFPFLGKLGAPVVTVRAAHLARIDLYRSRG